MDPPAPIWPAAWGAQPVALPRPPQPGSSAGIGTGVVIARPGVLLTAAHVVRGCTDIEVQAGLARLGGAEVRVTNARLDLALVVVPGLERTPLPVAGETRLGAEVAVMGFPGQSLQTGRPVVTIGNVSAIGPGKAEDIMQFSAPVQAGNSGGPLLDRQGRVVGIAIMSRDALRDLLAGLNIPQNVNFAVAPDSIARFLADHGVPQPRRRLARRISLRWSSRWSAPSCASSAIVDALWAATAGRPA
ncbi:S1 family peptidase [Crenalkalicoccus roseus]|uniref:S1 family peptidase n=1 Tax=Crenalkalicoccus roseus TaxID=1485588 RepID=UPI0013052A0A|nr:serine protease [Crenalkalicoccus roseus]